jgi:hypothetical protein
MNSSDSDFHIATQLPRLTWISPRTRSCYRLRHKVNEINLFFITYVTFYTVVKIIHTIADIRTPKTMYRRP